MFGSLQENEVPRFVADGFVSGEGIHYRERRRPQAGNRGALFTKSIDIYIDVCLTYRVNRFTLSQIIFSRNLSPP